jgi:hypothetical protein
MDSGLGSLSDAMTLPNAKRRDEMKRFIFGLIVGALLASGVTTAFATSKPRSAPRSQTRL